jgi:molecular chaperone GrpE
VQHEGDGGEGSRPVLGNVMRHGYKLGEQVLRHALVGVVDTVEGAADSDAADNHTNEGEQNAESEPS